jgi:hypothetical protein
VALTYRQVGCLLENIAEGARCFLVRDPTHVGRSHRENVENRALTFIVNAALLAGCTHTPQAYAFTSRRNAAEALSAAANFLTAAQYTIAVRTPHGIVTDWREIGRETVNIDVKGYRPETISDRKRVVLDVEPQGAGFQVRVRSEYATCPVSMPLTTTVTAAESCLRTYSISGRQQDAERGFYQQLENAVSTGSSSATPP